MYSFFLGGGGEGTGGKRGAHLDTHAVADLDAAGPGGGTELMHDADALVAADLAGLGGVGEGLPGVGHDAHVGVADAGVRAKGGEGGVSGVVALLCLVWAGVERVMGGLQAHEDLAGAGGGSVERGDRGGDFAGGIVDGGFVGGWDVEGLGGCCCCFGHFGRWVSR